ncbi:Alpha-L-fucosidase [Planctomycetes bacterium MalM25]|nr:Alpha-L-fucosidase [Planctomycetes bacterium MalM25]
MPLLAFLRHVAIALLTANTVMQPARGEEGPAPGRTPEETEALEWRYRTPRETRDVADYEWDAYQRDVPEWYQDAKYGVYAHWGPYNQGMEESGFTGMNNSWFAKYMYVKGHPYNQHHIATRGPLSEQGYSAYFDTFSVPEFDPVEWADLIAGSGARFAGPVAMHHDGFAMWDSQVVPWNAMNSAAKRDIAGELIQEYRRRGMKIVSSFHHAQNVTGHYYGGREGRLDDLPIDLDSDLGDPAYAKLFGRHATQAEAEEHWLKVLKEYITKYRPDQLWFDGGMKGISEESRYAMTSFYYDFCEREGIDGIISQKHDQIPRRVSLFDYERGGAPEILPRTWQTDDSPGPWMYISSAVFKDADWVSRLLTDIVSKNGVLLLNIAPLADGSIHPQQQKTLRDLGDWLEVNGEAIYGSRPWKVHYQGDEPHFYAGGKAFSKTYAEYGEDDLRFTRSKDSRTLYVFAMGDPPSGEVILRSLSTEELGRESAARRLGSSRVVPLGESADGHVVLPAGELMQGPGSDLKGPTVFKITGLR